MNAVPDAASSAATPTADAAPQTTLPVAEPAAAHLPARAPSASEVRRTTNVSGPGTSMATAATAMKLKNGSMDVILRPWSLQNKRWFLTYCLRRSERCSRPAGWPS